VSRQSAREGADHRPRPDHPPEDTKTPTPRRNPPRVPTCRLNCVDGVFGKRSAAPALPRPPSRHGARTLPRSPPRPPRVMGRQRYRGHRHYGGRLYYYRGKCYRSDYCTIPYLPEGIADRPLGFDFRAACKAHDKCYLVRHLSGKGLRGRRSCDKMFHRRLLKVCNRESGSWRRDQCRWLAKKAYLLVRKHGEKGYWDSGIPGKDRNLLKKCPQRSTPRKSHRR
jgi:hypothetical protein